MTDIYRLRLSRGTGSGNGHSPDWRLYEDRNDFVRDLTEAMIEARGRTAPNWRANDAENGRLRLNWMACGAWVRHVFKRDPGGHGVQQVIGAEKLVDGEWVDLHPVLVAPHVAVTL